MSVLLLVDDDAAACVDPVGFVVSFFSIIILLIITPRMRFIRRQMLNEMEILWERRVPKPLVNVVCTKEKLGMAMQQQQQH